MNDSPGVRPVQHRRDYPNLPNRQQGGQKKKDEEEENHEEEPKKGPPSPDGSSTIDLTA